MFVLLSDLSQPNHLVCSALATAIGSTSVDGSFATAKLATGTHTITAKYAGQA